MTFGAAGYLWLLLLVPVAALLYMSWLAWRVRAQRRFGAAARSDISAVVVPLLLLAAMVVVVLAAARPQYGHHEVIVEQRGIDLVIVLDVSQSMVATDTQPTRLARAQAEIGALLDRMHGDRVGLVIFAGRPFVRAPLTADISAVDRLVAGVHEERGLVAAGSDLGEAIRRATRVLDRGEADTRVMLIVSDGEDHGASISSTVETARVNGIRVYTAGVGTEAGAPVLDLNPESGAMQPRVGADGTPIATRLDAAALQAIAQTGSGRYVELSGDGRPLVGLASEFAALAATTFETQEQPQPIDRFRAFTAVALAFVVLGTLWAGLSQVRLRSLRWARLWPLAGAVLLVGAVCGESVADVNRRGNDQYRNEQYTAAVDTYRTAQAMDPSSAELYHNAGNALHQLGQFDAAIDEAGRGIAAGGAFAALLEYALGNHHAARGALIEALEAYKRSLLVHPTDQDAKHNLEVVRELLDSTPSPTPTPVPPELPPTPGSDGSEGDGSSSPDEGTPGAGEQNGDPGTPGPGTPRPGDGEVTPEELARALEDALAGIDQDFTVEEAIRVLELLERRNRSQITEPGRPIGGAPDY